jgi:hypothetical protein
MSLSWVVACAKFSLGSTVDVSSPRLAKFLRLFGDHAAIVNDLGSFHKEKKAYAAKKVLYLLNTVEEVRKTYSLPNDEAAKFVTLAIQVELEREMARELSRLNADSALLDPRRNSQMRCYSQLVEMFWPQLPCPDMVVNILVVEELTEVTHLYLNSKLGALHMTFYHLVFLFTLLRKRINNTISRFCTWIFAANIKPQFKKLFSLSLYCNGQCGCSITKLFKHSAVMKARYSLRTDCLP